MNIALTGAAGRIGSAVARAAVAAGHTVVGIDHVAPREPIEGVRHLTVDVTNYEALENAMLGCRALIHLAAIAASVGQLPHVVHNTNVMASYNALAAAARLGMRKVVQASSVNAIGLVFSRDPKFDYFPVDEAHQTRNEEPYSLSKYICEAQGDSIARRHDHMTISSLRFGAVVEDLEMLRGWRNSDPAGAARDLWSWTRMSEAVQACLLGLTAQFTGHQVFFITSDMHSGSASAAELSKAYYPDVPWRSAPSGFQSFFDNTKAKRMLGWRPTPPT
jgi:UDP-glucose 4-epimerase